MIEIWDCHYCNLNLEETFPNENQMFIFWRNSTKFPNIGKFSKETKTITSVVTWDQLQLNEFIYAYILRTPNITGNIRTFVKCIGKNNRCEFYDDGRCCDYYNDIPKCANKKEIEVNILEFED